MDRAAAASDSPVVRSGTALAVASVLFVLLLAVVMGARHRVGPRHDRRRHRRISPSRSSSASCWRRRSKRDGIAVTRKLNLGGTFICDRALRAGDVDVYPEYTGTALTAIFTGRGRQATRDAVLSDDTGAVCGRRCDRAAAARLRQHVRDSGPASRRGASWG